LTTLLILSCTQYILSHTLKYKNNITFLLSVRTYISLASVFLELKMKSKAIEVLNAFLQEADVADFEFLLLVSSPLLSSLLFLYLFLSYFLLFLCTFVLIFLCLLLGSNACKTSTVEVT
jgi:hypothetical protein